MTGQLNEDVGRVCRVGGIRGGGDFRYSRTERSQIKKFGVALERGVRSVCGRVMRFKARISDSLTVANFSVEGAQGFCVSI